MVGTATMGAMPSGSARFQLLPTSSKSQIGRVWPAMKATALAASRPLPPPKAITPSWPPPRKTATPSSTFRPRGLALTSLKTAVGRPAAVLAATASATIGRAARPGSVTSSGRDMPRLLQARGSSAMRPGPKRTWVG